MSNEAREYKPPEILSGQLWEQDRFPYFSRTIVLLGGGREDGKILGMLSTGDRDPQILCTEEDGTWRYTPEDLLARLKGLHYKHTGSVRPCIMRDAE